MRVLFSDLVEGDLESIGDYIAADNGSLSFCVELDNRRIMMRRCSTLGRGTGSRLAKGHPKGLALTRAPGHPRSPKACRPRVFWPASLTAEGDSPPSRWREGGMGGRYRTHASLTMQPVSPSSSTQHGIEPELGVNALSRKLCQIERAGPIRLSQSNSIH